MPRPAKGPRLHLRKARPDKRQAATWVIRDGAKEVGTGCGPERLADAQLALAEYIQEKWAGQPVAAADGASDPADVLVADVLTLYARGRGARAPDPKAVKARLQALLEFWGEKTLADVRRSTCEAYVAHRMAQPIRMAKDKANARRVSDQGARRELEDLSAAIVYWHDEHPLTRRPKVVLPPKAESSRDALTREQAARLLKAAMGWRWTPPAEADEAADPGPAGDAVGAKPKGKWKRLSKSAINNRAHLRRFVLIGLYTGSRPGVIPQLLWSESATRAWVDLDRGIVYRRGRSERDQRTKRRPLVKMPTRLLAHMRRWRCLDEALRARLERAHLDAGGDARQLPQLTSVLHHGSRPIDGRIRRGFASLVADAGLPPEITPHWMRHTCATWLMEADVPPWEAAGFTGMTTKTLEEHYGHHRPSHQAKARKALG